jgi:uncharacterized protein (DUF1501 family)
VNRALAAFDEDLRRLGRAREVATLVFSEFGRRLEENASVGTDHGTAGPVFVLGAVAPGLYGRHPSLTRLDRGGELEPTTDFRRVYASIAEEWIGGRDGGALFPGAFEPLGIFA